MDTPTAPLVVSRAPWWTLALAGAALAVFLSSALEALLVFDRPAIARGEWWRVLAGNIVHFSPAHLGADVGALAVAGAIVEWRGIRGYPALLALSALVVGVTVYAALPELRYFGGLSGIVVATVVYLCLDGLREHGAWRTTCAVALVLLAIKLAIELVTGQPLIGSHLPEGIQPVPLSHVAGGGSALALHLLINRGSRRA